MYPVIPGLPQHTFFSVEGIDGCGKSTFVSKWKEFLQFSFRDFMVSVVMDPRDTEYGKKIYFDVINVLGRAGIDTDAMLLLFFSMREQLIAEKIMPVINEGGIVISDRFFDTTYAYQTITDKGLSRDDSIRKRFNSIESVYPTIKPNITFLLDVPAPIAWERIEARREKRDTFENEKLSFMEQVRQNFLVRAYAESDRTIILDASQDPDTVFKQAVAEYMLILHNKAKQTKNLPTVQY